MNKLDKLAELSPAIAELRRLYKDVVVIEGLACGENRVIKAMQSIVSEASSFLNLAEMKRLSINFSGPDSFDLFEVAEGLEVLYPWLDQNIEMSIEAWIDTKVKKAVKIELTLDVEIVEK